MTDLSYDTRALRDEYHAHTDLYDDDIDMLVGAMRMLSHTDVDALAARYLRDGHPIALLLTQVAPYLSALPSTSTKKENEK